MGKKRFVTKKSDAQHFKLVHAPHMGAGDVYAEEAARAAATQLAGSDDDTSGQVLPAAERPKQRLVLQPIMKRGNRGPEAYAAAVRGLEPEQLGLPEDQAQDTEAQRALRIKYFGHVLIKDAERLEGEDCYFPPDGYDYEQHLAPVTGHGTANFEVTPEAAEEEALGPEAAAALAALEEEGYDEAGDDFFGTIVGQEGAAEVDEDAASRAVWGAPRPDEAPREVALMREARELGLAVSWQPGRNGRARPVLREPGAPQAWRGPLPGGSDEESEEYSDEESHARPRGTAAASTFMSEGELGRRRLVAARAEAALDATLAEYSEEELGELDEEDGRVRGGADLADTAVEDALDEFLDQQANRRLPLAEIDRVEDKPRSSSDVADGPDGERLMRGKRSQPLKADAAERAALASATRLLAERQLTEEAARGSGEEDFDEVEVAVPEQWDCETILSTKSNLENRPTRIALPDVRRKPRKPKAAAIPEEESDGESESGSEAGVPLVATGPRSRTETLEEKKARKAAVKEQRRACRVLKKQSKGVFKQEAAKLAAQTAPGSRVYAIP